MSGAYTDSPFLVPTVATTIIDEQTYTYSEHHKSSCRIGVSGQRTDFEKCYEDTIHNFVYEHCGNYQEASTSSPFHVLCLCTDTNTSSKIAERIQKDGVNPSLNSINAWEEITIPNSGISEDIANAFCGNGSQVYAQEKNTIYYYFDAVKSDPRQVFSVAFYQGLAPILINKQASKDLIFNAETYFTSSRNASILEERQFSIISERLRSFLGDTLQANHFFLIIRYPTEYYDVLCALLDHPLCSAFWERVVKITRFESNDASIKNLKANYENGNPPTDNEFWELVDLVFQMIDELHHFEHLEKIPINDFFIAVQAILTDYLLKIKDDPNYADLRMIVEKATRTVNQSYENLNKNSKSNVNHP